MLFKNFYNDNDRFRLNESNFISKDFTGLFDSDAKFRLTELTIDKLFEGLDLDKSEELHNFVKSNIPSLAPIMGTYKAKTTSAFELVRSQISYMDTRILFVEKELASGFEAVKAATKSDYKVRTSAISQITNPSGFSSVIPKINEAVKNFMKNSNIDLNSESLKQSFISLYNLDISTLIKQTLNNLEQSSSTMGLKALYIKIDSLKMEEIEADTATSLPKILVGSPLEPSEYIISNDIYDRLAGFYEMVINMYPYGQQLTSKFGVNYTSINVISGTPVGPDAILAMKQCIPSMDASVFQPMSELLNEVSSILIERVFIQSPDEDLKNIFTPSLQVMYMCMLSLLSLKLINLNLEVESLVTQKEKEIKGTEAETKYNVLRNKAMATNEIAAKLDELGFFTTDTLVYKVGSKRMNPEAVKLINNIFVYFGILSKSKYNSEIFDSITEEAVKDFQTKFSARLVDGKIGRETKNIIKAVTDKMKEKYAQGPLSPVGKTSFMATSAEDLSSVK